MSTAIERKDEPAEAALMEQVLLKGDLKDLSPAQRVLYYQRVCASLGLNPLTKPFDYITLNGRLTLYAKRDATDQLRRIHSVSVVITGRDRIDDLYVVSARATIPDGRSDESIGAVPTTGLKGEALANAMMKAETKSKRRVTLSIAGLGWLDETEAAAVPDGQPIQVDQETGEIIEAASAPPASNGLPAQAGTALHRLAQAMARTGTAEAQALQTARKLFGSATQKVRILADLSDAQLDQLTAEIEVKP